MKDYEIDEDRANKISSLIAAVGLINIPIIKYSVEWWSTLHQPASIKIGNKIEIRTTLAMFLATPLRLP